VHIQIVNFLTQRTHEHDQPPSHPHGSPGTDCVAGTQRVGGAGHTPGRTVSLAPEWLRFALSASGVPLDGPFQILQRGPGSIALLELRRSFRALPAGPAHPAPAITTISMRTHRLLQEHGHEEATGDGQILYSRPLRNFPS
jgi:hypothetical protein